MPNKGKLYLIWDDANLTILPSVKGLESQVLTIDVKSLVSKEGQPWKREVRKHREKLFTVISESPHRTIVTQQGLLDEVIMWCIKNGYLVEVKDARETFPNPRLDLMSGFRFSQKVVMEEALSKNRSGLISLPTRYGKAYCILNTVRAYPNVKTVIGLPGADLLQQTYTTMKEGLPCRDVRMIGGASRNKEQSKDLTLCSLDSLHYCDPTTTRLFIGDEIHASVTEGRMPLIQAFERARKLGFTATPSGRFDGRDKLMMGIYGPILSQRTFSEAVAEGAICQILCLLIVMPKTDQFFGTRDMAYRHLLFQNPKIAALLSKLCSDVIPPDWQTLMFIKNEKQADYLHKYVGEDNSVVAMAKKLGARERQEMFDRMSNGDVKRCLASDIYAQGVTFSDLRVVINLAGGGPYTQSIQKPGRLAEIRPGKKYGVMIDFMFPMPSSSRNGAFSLANDSKNRFELYKSKGYEIAFVRTIDELKQEIAKAT